MPRAEMWLSGGAGSWGTRGGGLLEPWLHAAVRKRRLESQQTAASRTGDMFQL